MLSCRESANIHHGSKIFYPQKILVTKIFEFTITDRDKAIKWKKNDHYGLSDIMFPTARKRKNIRNWGLA